MLMVTFSEISGSSWARRSTAFSRLSISCAMLLDLSSAMAISIGVSLTSGRARLARALKAWVSLLSASISACNFWIS